ncbi:putative polygalacturonase [Rosa chinensis]|uniref:Putative polygalacturonase n=1 Tax=Rosa chinensis TaxID=74649 RepID=A0A2P6RRF0_ROSCH|nr:putative polygalacturonase [Rosa chinensis]
MEPRLVSIEFQTLSFTNSKDIRVEGLSLNNQMFHIVINGCHDVLIQGVKIIAAGNSPNTDGIHVQFSKNVAIFDTSIKTRDDCVSIGPGAKDLWMERISCGPDHGIRTYENMLEAVAVKFDCSATNPCTKIRLENVNLTCRKQVVQSICTNVNGQSVGSVHPDSCL